MKALVHYGCASALIVFMGSIDAHALTAASADDICAPTVDPCVITASWDVTGPLDFGLRTVRITGAGRLRGQPDVVLSCGALECDVGPTTNPIIDADGGDSGNVTISAMRACSGDGSTRCFDDTACASGGLGTCSAGNTGTIAFDGKISGFGAYPNTASVRAAGDITLGQLVDFSASATDSYGGSIDVVSYGGSIVAGGPLKARSGTGPYGYNQGGFVEVHAAVDVDLSGGLDVWGGSDGGQVEIDAGRDIIVTSGLSGAAGSGPYANGGSITLTAGRDLIVQQRPGGPSPQLFNTDGGGSFYFYGYGNDGRWASGYGGYQYLSAGDDLSLAATAQLRSNGGPGAAGGYFWLSAEDTMTIEGDVHAEGSPPIEGGDSGNAGGYISIWAARALTLAPGAVMVTASPAHGGHVAIESDGLVVLDGEIDVRGGAAVTEYGYFQSGHVAIAGMADVVIGGRIHAGASYAGETSSIDVCRLTLTSTGVIDHTHGTPNPRNDDTIITVRESLITGAGSKLLADPAGGRNLITYRDSNKPPLLEGAVSPPPILSVNPSLVGCPVCGNFEIDQGESCDDGNTTSGDGCRADCQDEGCIAATPGFPSTSLCDDGAACTSDRCDPVAHACQHVVSCEEGVACTADACVAGACQHTADDARCDDRNDCTDDLCNAATGCVHADLTGGPCEDGDYCTVPGTCDDGDCIITDVSLTTDNRIKISFKAGSSNDVLKAIVSLPLTEFGASPTMTGMRVVLVDALDQGIYEDDLPAAQWEDRAGTGQAFSYRVEAGAVTTTAKVKRNPSIGVARASVKIVGGEMPGAAAQNELSLSLLFGSDPAVDQCLTARRVPCTPRGTGTSCRDD